ncbi:MAG: C39 family peptidase [Patescibacteria group bacterium]
MVFSLAALVLAHQLSGRILLAVEDSGRAWYVNPVNEQRYSLGSPDDAWLIMRSLALGISDADLARPLPVSLAGRILLAVEDHGKAYYVDPLTLKLRYLGRPADAFRVMSELGLGITNADLAKVPVASVSLLPPSRGIEGVQFTSQAPFGEWSDPRQQEGCEEASAFMAVKWARGERFTLEEARSAIISMSDWEKSTFGAFMDTSIDDTADRLVRRYLGFENFEVKKNIGIAEIKAELNLGKLVLIPLDGTKLNNPNFTAGGPARHMLVVTGFDESTDEFITNDPGTRVGEHYRYSAVTVASALRDYPSGDNAPLTALPTAMIVISKN